ncbi:MAG: AraC family transcriptional regulator, partial [Alistipes onderdonkii]|nr:AraC family transcriptional regulator [Alistipes onderdonkii]
FKGYAFQIEMKFTAYKCGFNNLSNFNRIFKKGKGLTPSVFKTFYTQKKISV